jgi:hypothetical protein
MKRHLLGLIMALLFFNLGLFFVLPADDCGMPWVRCDALKYKVEK